MKIQKNQIILIIILILIIITFAYFFIKGTYTKIDRPNVLHTESLSDYDFAGNYSKPTDTDADDTDSDTTSPPPAS
jgi:hypothetical protein